MARDARVRGGCKGLRQGIRHLQSLRIDIPEGAVAHVPVQVEISFRKADRILLCEPATHRLVVPCPVVVQVRPVMLPAGELDGIGGRETGDRGLAERGVGVFGGDGGCWVGQATVLPRRSERYVEVPVASLRARASSIASVRR